MNEALKWAHALRISYRHGIAGPATIVVRALFFVILLVIFSRLWRVTLPGGGGVGMLWYLAVTEWIVLSVPLVHLDVERDVRSGDLATHLLRPASYLGMRIAEALGLMLARMSIFLPVAAVCARLFSGGWPDAPLHLLLALPVGVLAGAVMVLFTTAIGVVAIWVDDASPLYWVYQKLAFVFGGLLLPLDIYPAWMRSIGSFTPFPWMLYGPARLAIHGNVAHALETAGALVRWGLLGGAGVWAVYRRGLRAFEAHGG